ncbi:hypothetical protein PR001_g29450 [Phytophthora rubi]|uniref:Chromo domain-containing protein n=1 Tax=Phytophthora rubi TaxID=129364 RepID=A0A6A3H302_9STRA|nr:hypothetical protein PR001_g29450 [Phytophthora rubi]
MKVNGEAYTLDIPTSLRLHPTFYVGRLKKYHAAAIPSMTNPPAPERRARAPHDAQSAPQTGVAELPPVTPRSHASPARESAPAALDLTGAAPQAPSEPAPLGSSPPPPERSMHESQFVPGHLGLPKRTSYRREPPPPIVDSAGDMRWIVDHIVAHEDPRRATPRTHTRANNLATRGIPAARRYRVRCRGFSPDDDTWEPCSTLLWDVRDVVREYEDENATVSDLAASENANDHAQEDKSSAAT